MLVPLILDYLGSGGYWKGRSCFTKILLFVPERRKWTSIRTEWLVHDTFRRGQYPSSNHSLDLCLSGTTFWLYYCLDDSSHSTLWVQGEDKLLGHSHRSRHVPRCSCSPSFYKEIRSQETSDWFFHCPCSFYGKFWRFLLFSQDFRMGTNSSIGLVSTCSAQSCYDSPSSYKEIYLCKKPFYVLEVSMVSFYTLLSEFMMNTKSLVTVIVSLLHKET